MTLWLQRVSAVVFGLGILCFSTVPADAQLTRELDFLKAIKDGDYEEIRRTVLGNINLNTRNIEGTPGLILAIQNSDGTMIGILLEAGANPDILDRKSGETPLTFAASRNNTNIVELLLKEDADPNTPNKQYETALIKAVSNSNRSMVRMLMAAGADPNWQDFTGHSAVWYAEASRRPGLIKLLQAPPGS